MLKIAFVFALFSTAPLLAQSGSEGYFCQAVCVTQKAPGVGFRMVATEAPSATQAFHDLAPQCSGGELLGVAALEGRVLRATIENSCKPSADPSRAAPPL